MLAELVSVEATVEPGLVERDKIRFRHEGSRGSLADAGTPKLLAAGLGIAGIRDRFPVTAVGSIGRARTSPTPVSVARALRAGTSRGPKLRLGCFHNSDPP